MYINTHVHVHVYSVPIMYSYKHVSTLFQATHSCGCQGYASVPVEAERMIIILNLEATVKSPR